MNDGQSPLSSPRKSSRSYLVLTTLGVVQFLLQSSLLVPQCLDSLLHVPLRRSFPSLLCLYNRLRRLCASICSCCLLNGLQNRLDRTKQAPTLSSCLTFTRSSTPCWLLLQGRRDVRIKHHCGLSGISWWESQQHLLTLTVVKSPHLALRCLIIRRSTGRSGCGRVCV